MRAYKTFLSIGILALCGLTAPAALAGEIQYAISVDTSSQILNYGYIELQFNPSSMSTQAADAMVEDFATDGILNPSDPNNDEDGDVSGTLPGIVSFDNLTSYNDYFEGITLGDTISFDLFLSGPAIDSSNGDGGGTFTLDFVNSGITGFLFTSDPTNDVPVFTVNINPDGSTTGATYPTVSNGTPVVTAFPEEVPEPSVTVLLAGGLVAIRALRRRRNA